MENTNTPEVSVPKEEEKVSRKGELALSLVVLALLVVLGFIYSSNQKKVTPTNPEPAKTVIDPNTIPPKKTDLGTTLPEGFLSTIPLEKNATLTQSYTKEYNSGMLQQSVAFRSAKTKEANYTIYEQFFKRDGWTITPGAKTERAASITGTKDSNTLEILLITNKATSTLATIKSNVIINLLTIKK